MKMVRHDDKRVHVKPMIVAMSVNDRHQEFGVILDLEKASVVACGCSGEVGAGLLRGREHGGQHNGRPGAKAPFFIGTHFTGLKARAASSRAFARLTLARANVGLIEAKRLQRRAFVGRRT